MNVRTTFLLAVSAAAFAWVAAAQTSPAFPLRVSENKRYLEDSKGTPFFLHGDSPWEISWLLTRKEVEHYLDNRRRKGFNAILVDGLPYTDWYTGSSDHLTQKNREGQAPFRAPGDVATPNDAYFDNLEWIVSAARARGMLVMLLPADLGAGGPGMWRPEYLSNGAKKMGDFARYLGRRFRKHPNVLWVLGGDRDPSGVYWHVDEMAQGLRETAPEHLITYHAGAKSSGVFFQEEQWLDVGMSYGYRDPHIFVAEDYRRQPVKPTFLGESGYEGENLDGRGGSPHRMRRQAYWSILSGACGHTYGTAAWHMQPDVWPKWIDSPGSEHMARFGEFFRGLPWHRLQPDFGHTVVVDGAESGSTLATTAVAADRTLALTYMPTPRKIVVDLSRLQGPVEARWFDPTAGTFETVAGSPFGGSGQHLLKPPERNAAGDGDWVLVLSRTRR